MRWFRFLVISSDGLRRSIARVWINERDLDAAENEATSHLRGLGWEIEVVERSAMPSTEEISRLEPTQAGAYRNALADGVYAYFGRR